MDTGTKLLAPITFNRGNLAKIGNDNSSTTLAIVLILINAVLGGILEAQNGGQIGSLVEQAGVSGVATGLGGFIIGFGFYLLFLLFACWGINVAASWFGGKVDTMEVLRMLGFTSIWLLIGTVVTFVVPSLGFIFNLAFLVAMVLGLGASAEINPIMAFLALIVGAIICFIVVFIVMLGLVFLLFVVIGISAA